MDGVKKQLKVDQKKKKVTTLDAPLHRQAKQRIESSVAYKEAKLVPMFNYHFQMIIVKKIPEKI